MLDKKYFSELTCGQCAHGAGLDFAFSFAFQPIVDVEARRVWSYEALVRGPNGEPASHVLDRLTDENRYRFDQSCRVKAVRLAAELGLTANLNINFFPNAVYRPELCIRTTLAAASHFGLPVERIVFEITEGEEVADHAHLVGIIEEYKRLGFGTAIDDFGAGYAGLNLLAQYQADYIKLDLKLIRDIDRQVAKQAIVQGVVEVCRKLSIEPLAEGVETREEFAFLRDLGIRLFQGFYFATPSFERLDPVADALYELQPCDAAVTPEEGLCGR